MAGVSPLIDAILLLQDAEKVLQHKSSLVSKLEDQGKEMNASMAEMSKTFVVLFMTFICNIVYVQNASIPLR